MNFPKPLPLVAVSTLLSVAIAIGAFEAYSNFQYGKWKSDFDNQGWFGKITIPSQNPVLMWEYGPNREHREISTNSHGFRGHETSLAKPTNVKRFAFVGDSVTLGMKVQMDETFTDQFAQIANSKQTGVTYEALNLGVDGYNILQVREVVRTKAFMFAPDAIVYTLCLNDFDLTESSGKKFRYFKKPRSFLLEKVDLLSQKWSGVDFHVHHYNENKAKVLSELLEMRAMVEEQGVRFYVAVMPVFPRDSPSFRGHPTQVIHDEMSSFLDKQNFEHLDLLGIFQETERKPSEFATDIWHPNAEGHEMIAQELVRWIVEG